MMIRALPVNLNKRWL